MYLVTLISDPADISRRTEWQVPAGTVLADWLLETFGPDGFELPTEIFVGGLSADKRIDWQDYEQVNVEIDGPVYILQSPLGTELLWYAVISIVVAVAVTALMPIPDVPGAQRQRRESPNNALSGQRNIARPLDRVPEIFGQVKSYPDLIAPTVSEYINHEKQLTEYVCVGRGYYSLADWKSGVTLIDDIPNSTVTEFEPGSVPSEVLKTRQSNEVANQLLPGDNEGGAASFSPDDSASVNYDSGTDIARVLPSDSSKFNDFTVGENVTLSDIYAETGGTDYLLDGTYVIDAIIALTGELDLQAASTVQANWTNFGGSFEPILHETGGTVLEPLITSGTVSAVIGPFVVPGEDNNDEVWVDLQAPKGLAQGNELNETKSVEVQFTFEELDSGGSTTGTSFTVNHILSENTRDPRFWTFKVTPANSSLVAGTRYQVSCERLTDTSNASVTILEDIRWTRLAGIQDVAAVDTSGTTRAVIETQASEQVAAIQERQFNVLATRKTVTWDGSSVVGNIDTGTGLTASRRFADAFLHYILDDKLAARTIAALDVQALYDIQDDLDAVFSGEKGEFSHTFSNQNTPALEELRIIALAARCFVYKEGSVFSVIRDEEQSVARGLFNRRNKVPDAESRTVRFNRPLDVDGVTLEYNDLTDDQTRVITFPNDLPASDPNFGMDDTINPQRIEATGIRQWSQAWDRAQYEFRRQIYRRVNVQSTVTMDGALLPLNARIQHVDGTRLTRRVSDGEVKAVAADGVTITTSQKCVFDPAETYSVVLRDEDGSPSSAITVTERSDTEFGFVLSSAPGFTIKVRGDDNYQRGTLYSFGPDGNDLAEAYLVQRKVPDEKGHVKLELINYTDEYYAADDTTPPARPTL